MFYKQYGNTDMKVSAIGFGGMRFDEADVEAGNFEKCGEVVLYAHEQGINYFDTAPFYCADKSEIIMGKALSQLDRNSYYVTSKANFGTLMGDGKPTRDNFMKRLETSLERLKVDYIDFYHMWCVLNTENYEKQHEALFAFHEEAKSQGLIKNMVFSSHMQGADLTNVINTDRFKGMLIGYNALNYRFRQEGIVAAHDKGMGIVVMNPLGGGEIPRNPKLFSYLTEGTDLNVAQAALRFVAAHKEITVTLNGFTTKEQIDEAVKAVENLELMTAAEVCKKYDTDNVTALNDLCTGCGYCKQCPVDIDIPKYMDIYNQKMLGGTDEDIRIRTDLHWCIDLKDASKCVACGKCEKLCTQHLPIIDRLKELAQMADAK